MELALKQINVEKAAREAGVPASTLRYDLNKVKKGLAEVLSNEKPGPKTMEKEEENPKEIKKREACQKCGGKLNKNGTYWVLNWIAMLLTGWLVPEKVQIQRWRCKECGHEAADKERVRQAEARKAWWQVIERLIVLSRFKLGLSERKTQILIGFTYAKTVDLFGNKREKNRIT